MNKSWVRRAGLTLTVTFVMSAGAPLIGAKLAGMGFEPVRVFWIAATLGLIGLVGALGAREFWLMPIFRYDRNNDRFLQWVVAPLAGFAQSWLALFVAKIFSPPMAWETLLFFIPLIANGIVICWLAHWWAKSISTRPVPKEDSGW